MKDLLDWVETNKIGETVAALLICNWLVNHGDPADFEGLPANMKQAVEELIEEYHATGKIISIGGGGGGDHTEVVAKAAAILQR